MVPTSTCAACDGSTFLRNPLLRPRFVLDALIGQPPLSMYALKKRTGKPSGDNVRHLYSPAEVRRAKLGQLDPPPTAHTRLRPPIIDIVMPRSETGKTLLAVNLATGLAFMGYRVLCIDGDPQATLTARLGCEMKQGARAAHIGNLLDDFCADQARGTVDFSRAVVHVYPHNMLDLIPSDITLTRLEDRLAVRGYSETMFDDLVDANPEFFGRYDAIIIDSAPGASLLSLNFMRACKTILAPVWLDNASFRALELLVDTVENLNRTQRTALDIEIVANGYNQNDSQCRDAFDALAERYAGRLNATVLPILPCFGRPFPLGATAGSMIELEPGTAGAKIMLELAKSLLSRYQVAMGGLPHTRLPRTRGMGQTVAGPAAANDHGARAAASQAQSRYL